jgi:hypothetical protein
MLMDAFVTVPLQHYGNTLAKEALKQGEKDIALSERALRQNDIGSSCTIFVWLLAHCIASVGYLHFLLFHFVAIYPTHTHMIVEVFVFLFSIFL